MKNTISVLLISFFVATISAQEFPTELKTDFDSVSLNQNIVDKEGNTTTVGKIIESHKGKIIFIDLWASWCGDCIKGMPKLKEVQQQNPDLVYVFFSLDKNEDASKKGIDKYEIKGEHYWFSSGWKNDFTNYIGLNWIPRYMLIDAEGKIAHYYAIHADDPQMMEALVELKIVPEAK